jgi:hypothetical protein
VIGRLDSSDETYTFQYTMGIHQAKIEAGFDRLSSFPEFEYAYESKVLFPLFTNRVPRQSRPDYGEMVKRLDLPQSPYDPVAILTRSGGRRTTDSLEVFPHPVPDDFGRYQIHFFAHGSRHLPSENQTFVVGMTKGTRLLLCGDLQNSVDDKAVLLRSEGGCLVGWIPRYFLEDIHLLIERDRSGVRVTVERVNPEPGPVQQRLLCRLEAIWLANWRPMLGEEFQPLESNPETLREVV